MGQELLLGIDVGTTGTKAIAFDTDGKVAATAYEEYVCTYPAPNWVEQDCKMLIRAVFSCCRAVTERLGAESGHIAGISVSAQRSCTVLADSAGQPIKMISWLDNRATEQVEEIAAALGRERYYTITGMPLAPTWVLPKLLHTREKAPDIWSKTARVLQLQEVILHALGVEDFYADEPDATFWGTWDSRSFCHSREILDAFRLSPHLFPQVLPAGTPVGSLSSEAAAQTGLREGTPLCVGIGDQNSAALGAGVVAPGDVSVSIGTGGLATVLLDRFYRDPKGQAMITHHASHGLWTFEGLQNAAAGVFRWFRNEIAALEWQQYGEAVYDRLNEMIAQTPAGANGLLMLPFFAGSAAPRWNAEARGCILGLTLRHTRSDMARACVEGITLEQKDILQSLSGCGVAFQKVRIVGGATKSAVWNQIQADMYGIPCETLAVKDAAALGAAICAGVGCGLFPDLEQAVKRMVQVERRYTPDPAVHEIYEDLCRRYTQAYEALDAGGVF